MKSEKTSNNSNVDAKPASYALSGGKGKYAPTFIALLASGKVGSFLVETGLEAGQWEKFLAEIAVRLVKSGKTSDELAGMFSALCAGNASQARQVIEGLTITFPGEAPQSISAYWGRADKPKSVAVDFSAVL